MWSTLLSHDQINNSNGLAIHGEEIKPVISRLDGKRKVSELLDISSNKALQQKDPLTRKNSDSKEVDKSNKVNEKVKNIYNLKKDPRIEEKKVVNEFKENKPALYTPIQVNKSPIWVKAEEDHNEINPFPDDPVIKQKEIKAKEKVGKYRQSILQFLESENNEESFHDGLETNREESDDGDRDDDNILEGTAKSIKANFPQEEEKDLPLDDEDEVNVEERIEIEGESYFKISEELNIDPLPKILKNIIITKFGVENTEKGIDFIKSKSDSIYKENLLKEIISDFKTQWFIETEENILEFISTASSYLSYV